jgi:hypothetical protein
MEHDDGKREWSVDIRVDPRRHGGRLVSRWLKEERGGGDEVAGGRTTNSHPQNSYVAHTRADVSRSSQSNQNISLDSNKLHLMTIQGSSLTINAQQSANVTIGAHAQSSHMISNHISNNQPNNIPSITIPTHINSSNFFVPPNLLNTPPNNIPQLIIDQNNLPILNSPNTKFNAINLSQNRPITFNSQNLMSDPHQLSLN